MNKILILTMVMMLGISFVGATEIENLKFNKKEQIVEWDFTFEEPFPNPSYNLTVWDLKGNHLGEIIRFTINGFCYNGICTYFDLVNETIPYEVNISYMLDDWKNKDGLRITVSQLGYPDVFETIQTKKPKYKKDGK